MNEIEKKIKQHQNISISNCCHSEHAHQLKMLAHIVSRWKYSFCSQTKKEKTLKFSESSLMVCKQKLRTECTLGMVKQMHAHAINYSGPDIKCTTQDVSSVRIEIKAWKVIQKSVCVL